MALRVTREAAVGSVGRVLITDQKGIAILPESLSNLRSPGIVWGSLFWREDLIRRVTCKGFGVGHHRCLAVKVWWSAQRLF